MGLVASMVLDRISQKLAKEQRYSYKPYRLHGTAPIIGSLSYLKRVIELPDESNAWYVYQLGTYFESHDRLPVNQKTWEVEKWRTLGSIVSSENLHITVHTNKGVSFPLFCSYYLYTQEKALLIAVRAGLKIPANLSQEDLYVRLYRNDFYDTTEGQLSKYKLKTAGYVLGNAGQLTQIKTEINNLITTAGGGHAIVTINGRQYRNPQVSNVSSGDLVEYLIDPTVHHVEQVSIPSGGQYVSNLDNTLKQIISCPLTFDKEQVQLASNLEMDLLTQIDNDVFFGTRYPYCSDDEIRQITPRDFAIRADTLARLTQFVVDYNPSDYPTYVFLEVKYRYGYYNRQLEDTTLLQRDIQTLPLTNKLQMLVTPGLTPPQLSAIALENHGLYQTALEYNTDTLMDVQAEALYGYNALSKEFGIGILKTTTVNNQPRATIPDNYKASYTAYEYNYSGKYLENHSKVNTATYLTGHPSAALVEVIKGQASRRPSAQYGKTGLTYYPGWGHRYYACAVNPDGTPTYQWSDITDTGDYTVNLQTNTIAFTNPSDSRLLMVRCDNGFFADDVSVYLQNNLLLYTVNEQTLRQGQYLEHPLEVPCMDLQVFAFTLSLVRDLDYFVDGPNVYFANLKYLRKPLYTTPQSFHVRAVGLYPGNTGGPCKPVLDKGLVSHGYVGAAGKFVVKSDKIPRVTIDGYLQTPESVKYWQDDLTGTNPSSPLNHLPYQINPLPMVINDKIQSDQEDLKPLSEALDNQAGATLTQYLPVVDRGPMSTTAVTQLVCPFLGYLTDLILGSLIPEAEMDPSRTDAQVQATLDPIRYLLNIGPCRVAYGYLNNPKFQILPHPQPNVVSLMGQNHYTFFIRAVNLNISANNIALNLVAP